MQSSIAVVLMLFTTSMRRARCLSLYHTLHRSYRHQLSSLAMVESYSAADEAMSEGMIDAGSDYKISKSQLRDELRRYRVQQSAPIDKPAFFVFSNAVMEDIYRNLPSNKEELLDIKGIGKKKLDMFGDDILSIVAKYANAVDLDVDETIPTSALMPKTPTIEPETLTDEQRYAAHFPLDNTLNAFITGAAGTGKSYVVKYIIQELKRRQSKYGVCAPTGVAAINVGGSTINAFFGIGLGNGSVSSLIQKVRKKKEAVKRIDETDILLIDECSMLSSNMLELLDAVVREVRKKGEHKDESFGGMQIIAVGDFFQLPPIYQRDSGGMDRRWRPFCFDSPVWDELGLMKNKIELKEVQRQGGETRFVDFLNLVRVGQVTESIIRDFNAKCLISTSRPLPTDGIVPTRLHVLNRDVDAVNESRLAELKDEEIVCKASNEWREKMPSGSPASVKKSMKDSIEKEMPDEVRLKVGAQVMLTRNKALDRNLINGSRGVVERFVMDSDGDQIPIVRFDSGNVEKIAKVEAVRYNPDGSQGCLVRTQIPLKLAWALTVHKSQGTTLSRVLLDVSSAFEFGQVYVALSRVRSLDGLWLERPATLRNIMVSPQVLDFYDNI